MSLLTTTTRDGRTPRLHRSTEQRLQNALTRLRSLLGDGQFHSIKCSEFCRKYNIDNRFFAGLVLCKAVELQAYGNLHQYRRTGAMAQLQANVLHKVISGIRKNQEAQKKAIAHGTAIHQAIEVTLEASSSPVPGMVATVTDGCIPVTILYQLRQRYPEKSIDELKVTYAELMTTPFEKPASEAVAEAVPEPVDEPTVTEPAPIEATTALPGEVAPAGEVTETSAEPVSHRLFHHPLVGELTRYLEQSQYILKLKQEKRDLEERIKQAQLNRDNTVESFYSVNRELTAHRFVYSHSKYGVYLVTTCREKTLEMRPIHIETARY